MTGADCANCATARTKVWAGFRVGCTGCEARALSRTPAFFESRKTRRLSAVYVAALETMGLTHDQVKAAHAADFEGGARP